MKKIISLLLILQLSSSASVILYTDVPESFKNFLLNLQKEAQYQVNRCSSEYMLEVSTYDPHISLAYLSKEKLSLKKLYENEPLLKPKLIALANRIAHINMNQSIQNLEIELWQARNPRTYLGTTYSNVVIIVIKLPVPPKLLEFTQHIEKEMDSLPSIDKKKFDFQAHATIGWLYHVNDQDPKAMAEKIKAVLQPYIDQYNEQHHEFSIDSFVLAAGNQKKKFILNARTSSAFQPARSRPCARPALPGCSYRPRACTPAQNACPRSR
jgi:hypothetical protein